MGWGGRGRACTCLCCEDTDKFLCGHTLYLRLMPLRGLIALGLVALVTELQARIQAMHYDACRSLDRRARLCGLHDTTTASGAALTRTLAIASAFAREEAVMAPCTKVSDCGGCSSRLTAQPLHFATPACSTGSASGHPGANILLLQSASYITYTHNLQFRRPKPLGWLCDLLFSTG